MDLFNPARFLVDLAAEQEVEERTPQDNRAKHDEILRAAIERGAKNVGA